MTLFRAIAIALPFLFLLPGSSRAQEFYAAGFGGLNLALDSDVDDSSQGIDQIAHDPGFALGGALGYKFTFQMRLEGEVTYRRNGVDEFEILGSNQNGEGDVSALSVMVNAFYDFDNSTRWTPYLGGGLGFARVDWDGAEASGGARLDNAEYLGAAQFGGGIAFRVTESLELTADYRAFATGVAEFEDQSGDDIEIDYVSSTLMLGVRVKF